MAETVFSFEQKHLARLRVEAPGRIALSRLHRRDGQQSLHWAFAEGGRLIIDAEIPYRALTAEAVSQARATFVCYLYRETADEARLRFSFYKGEKEACAFTCSLHFRGWRALWVPFDSDMEGQPLEGMDRLEILVTEGAGDLWLDQLILAVPIDPRHPTRDCQQPWVNQRADRAANAHWLSLYRFWQLEQEALAPTAAETPAASPEAAGQPTAEREQAERVIAERLDAFIAEAAQKHTFSSWPILAERVAAYEIREVKGRLLGRTVDTAAQRACWPEEQAEELLALTRPIDVKETSQLLLDLAFYIHFDLPAKAKAEAQFILLCRHLLDQGFAEGSALGTAHHLGYPLRPFFFAVFLMRDLLRTQGLLPEMSRALAWFTGRGRIFRPDEELQHESMDTFNTFAPGLLAAALLEEEEGRRARLLGAFQHWLNRTLRPAPGLEGPLKADGSLFHHCAHYPAYGLGGLRSLAPILYCLSGTPYAVCPEAHALLRRAVLALRLYSNLLDWPIAMSARHPLGRGPHAHIFTLDPFRYMALAGSPDGRRPIDPEPAAAYLRLAERTAAAEERDAISFFRRRGFRPEPDPTGHWSMNYAAAAIHRRADWLVTVRGHSRYLWANESYLNANLYGRNITYGQLEILNRGRVINQRDSGYQPEGFDFNCFPGTTARLLPSDMLCARVLNLDSSSGFEEMLLSDESFCGGLTFAGGRNGLFAMKLHGHPKYADSLRANKSWFFFDDYILCLGSGIESCDPEHPVVTTLWQKHQSFKDTPVVFGGRTPAPDAEVCLSSDGAEDLVIMDNKACAYLVPAGQRLKMQQGMQLSHSPIDCRETCGRFVKAYIEHGTAPRTASYTYAVIVDAAEARLRRLAQEPPCRVLRRDKAAHIVEEKANAARHYVLFEPFRSAAEPLVLACARPALLSAAVAAGGDEASLSVCDPDLRLYEGLDPEQYNAAGERLEVSLYSRPWRGRASAPGVTELELAGLWEITGEQADFCCTYRGGNTLLSLVCRDAMNYNLKLKRLKQ